MLGQVVEDGEELEEDPEEQVQVVAHGEEGAHQTTTVPAAPSCMSTCSSRMGMTVSMEALVTQATPSGCSSRSLGY